MCKLNIRHEWHIEHAEDGSLYKRCLRCGKDDDQRGITVTDNGASTAGWSTSVLLMDFTGEATGARLSAAGATNTPTAATATGTVSVTASPAMDPTTPKIIQTATCVTGNNAATWDAGLSPQVPTEGVVDASTATVTYSVS